MAPDLPYVPTGVPASGEADQHHGRFAWPRPAFTRSTAAGPGGDPTGRRRAAVTRRVRTVVGLLAVCAVGFTLAVPSASADDLSDKKARISKQLENSRQQLNESTSELSSAAAAVERSEQRLAGAEAELARTQQDLAMAQQRDQAMELKLDQAEKALAKAKAAVVKGQQAVDVEQLQVGSVVRSQYQQQTNLVGIAILAENSSTADLATRLQWSTTMFDTTQATMDRLTALQRKLKAERALQTNLEAEIAKDRAAAAANLNTRQGLKRQAAAQQASVAALVQKSTVARKAAQGEVNADKERYGELQTERTAVDQRIAARIAAQKAAAAARQAAAAARQAAAEARNRKQIEKAQRHAAEARRQAAEARRQSAQAERQSSSHSPSSSRSRSSSQSQSSSPGRPSSQSQSSSRSHRSTPRKRSQTSAGGSGFSMPVDGPITSPYGMRFHPVLHYWKLHDGTDFGVGCGTPMRAPYAGTVSERYFNAGYGNRLMIDHGNINGHYVTTGYNHAIRYIVGVGQHVSKGQVIGYVGTTGYSTGCHLHLMTWEDGTMMNPMSTGLF